VVRNSKHHLEKKSSSAKADKAARQNEKGRYLTERDFSAIGKPKVGTAARSSRIITNLWLSREAGGKSSNDRSSTARLDLIGDERASNYFFDPAAEE